MTNSVCVCACTCVSDVSVDVHSGKIGSQQLYSRGVLRIINVCPRKKRNSSPASPLSLSKHAPDQPQQDRADRGWDRRGGAHTIVRNDAAGARANPTTLPGERVAGSEAGEHNSEK